MVSRVQWKDRWSVSRPRGKFRFPAAAVNTLQKLCFHWCGTVQVGSVWQSLILLTLHRLAFPLWVQKSGGCDIISDVTHVQQKLCFYSTWDKIVINGSFVQGMFSKDSLWQDYGIQIITTKCHLINHLHYKKFVNVQLNTKNNDGVRTLWNIIHTTYFLLKTEHTKYKALLNTVSLFFPWLISTMISTLEHPSLF